MIRRRSFLQLATALTCGRLAGSGQACRADEIGSLPQLQRLTERLNPSIVASREVGLSLLKPSASELQRGLRLHAESIVFDSYGFSPRASIDGAVVAKEIEAGASDMEIKDLREEMTMTRCITDAVQQQEYRDAWRAAGVTCVFQNAGEECQDPLVLIKRLARFTFVTDMLRGFVSKAAVPDDIEQAKLRDQHCLYMTGNGVPLNQQWVSVSDELRYVRIFYQLGIRMMHLTYQRRNMIGTDVAYSAQDSGEEQRKLPAMRKRRDDFRTLWPVDSFRTTPEMTNSLAWTNWPLFTVGLVQRGYNDDQIRKIIGGNVMRVARETLHG